jgi:uncharacterized membrane protein
MSKPNKAMSLKVLRFFILSAGLVLMLTGLAKCASAFGDARILAMRDPILTMPYRYLLCVAGCIEVIIGLYCVTPKQQFWLRAAALAWLSTILFAYRFGLYSIHYQKPCKCLGNLADALHISPQSADAAMAFVLAYLLFGSFGSLLWLWRNERKRIVASGSFSTAIA